MTDYKSPIHQMVQTTPTDFWNDSCGVADLTYAIEHGAVGATSNPTIVLEVLKKEMPLWKDRIYQLINDNPTWSEEQLTWRLFEEVTVKGSTLLLPVFERHGGRKGRQSIQTNPVNYRSLDALVQQALYFDGLAPNLQVKLPVTRVGIAAIEEVTYCGVNINATVSFTVPQALAVGAAVERGLRRREAEGKPVETMSPVCTIMVGRLDDWMQVLIKRDNIATNPGVAHWAGIAAVKRAYEIYQERGYRARLLVAAYRHHLHWSELIGGDVVQSIPPNWQRQFNASDIPVRTSFFEPVDPLILAELNKRFPDFRRAYEPDGLSIDEFDTFGATVRTLRGFIGSLRDLQALVREFMLPDPDVKK